MTLYKATAEGQVPMTSEEEAEVLADRAASAAADARRQIMSEIERLEGAPNYLNRGARELQLRLMEKEAEELAAERGLTKEQVLSATSYYLKLKALDDEIKALRVQL